MPYALDIPRHLPGCLNWSDLSQTPKDSPRLTRLDRAAGEPVPPIPFMQAHYEQNHKRFPIPRKLPDIFQGRWSSSLFVSDRFRAIVAEMDPVAHLFQPVELTMLNGSYFPTGYYALGIGARVEAIDAENSEVIAKSFDGKFAYYAGARGEPMIQWHADRIAGHHLWMDRHYSSEAFISDALAAAFKRARIKGLSLRPSAISGGPARSSRGHLEKVATRLRRWRNRRYDALE